jgi:glucosylceramidase
MNLSDKINVKMVQTSMSGDKWTEKDVRLSSGITSDNIIVIDENIKYHPYLGIGSDLTDCSCYNLTTLSEEEREKHLRRLYDPVEGAGWNLVRDDIGSSDFSKIRYSLAETPNDLELIHFSIEHDLEYNIPIMKKALSINPDILFVASPWSPPAWMKDTNSMVGPGGKLLKKYYDLYALYLVKYIQAFEQQGIKIHAINSQNEPEAEHGAGEGQAMPQCLYTAAEEKEFIINHLKPALNKAGLKTEIWAMDHNYNMEYYITEILDDPAAEACIDGIAWHHYVGEPEAMKRMAERYPVKGQYFTEGQLARWKKDSHSLWGSSLAKLFRNGSRTFINWITLLDSDGGPGEGEFISPRDVNRPETFDTSIVDKETKEVYINEAYYMMGHIGRYVKRGAFRIESSDTLSNAAFLNPDGSIILYVENNSLTCKRESFVIKCRGIEIDANIPEYSVQTYIFK